MRIELSLGLRRMLAFSIDWLLIVLWGGAVFGVLWLVRGGEVSLSTGPWIAQLLGLLAMTLPVSLYFAACESSRVGASLGKRLLGLRVVSLSGTRLSFRRALVRTLIKFVPWELGHMVTWQAMASEAQTAAPWIWGVCATSMGLAGWWAASVLAGRPAPYDAWSQSRVVALSQPRARAAS